MTQPAKRARLLLADDHSLTVEGLRSMLESKFDVVGTAADGRSLIQAAEQLKPDVILLDISMPELNGIEAARQLRKILPKTRLIFVTMHADATFVHEALRSGASGYLTKQCRPAELISAIQEVLAGRIYLSPLVTKDFVDHTMNARSAAPFGRLTTRQREVLQLVAEGRSAKEIAEILHIAPKTVEFHKSGIMRALGLRTLPELVKYAIRHGMVSP
jgi:DNA-binding NarL/FixJ family response regulator